MENIAVSNLLIVESNNDQYFIEALITHMNLNIVIDFPICSVDEYECLGGMGKLEEKLNSLKRRVNRGEIDKVGIIFDADSAGITQRKQQINDKIDTVFGENPATEFLIYIMNINDKGELETLLKAIKCKDSTIADCLKEWQQCMPKEKRLKQKDFDKFWIQIYQRYDACTKKEKKQAGRKCNNEASLKKDAPIYNFDADIPELHKLKAFLLELSIMR